MYEILGKREKWIFLDEKLVYSERCGNILLEILPTSFEIISDFLLQLST